MGRWAGGCGEQLGEPGGLVAACEASRGRVDRGIKAVVTSVAYRSLLGCGCRLHKQSGAGGQGGCADG